MVVTVGTSASSSVLSPTSERPRALMPAIAALSMATICSGGSSLTAPAVVPARRNAVPQIGPEVPPMRLVMTTAIFFRNVPMSARSKESQSCSTSSNPRAMEYPKSPSPTTASRSPKYFSLATAVCAIVCTTTSTSPKLAAGICAPGCLSGIFDNNGQVGQGDPRPRPGSTGVGQHAGGLAAGVAERGHHQGGLAEVLRLREVVDRDHAGQPGADGGQQAIAGVLDHHRLVRGHAEPADGQQVDVRGGLLARHDVARE